MSDIFSFGGISASSKKQALNVVSRKNPVLVDKSRSISDYNFIPVILVEDYYNNFQLEAIENFLQSAGLHKYKIIASIDCLPDKESIDKDGIIKFYRSHRIDMQKFLPQHCPILTVGPALYALLKEDDIYPSHVQQIIFGKSNFLFSEDLTFKNCHRIFPIEGFKDIFAKGFKKPVDSFKTKLAQIQINNIHRIGGKPCPRYPKLHKIFINSEKEFYENFYLKNKDRHEYVAWDLETSGLDWTRDTIGCITLSFDGIEGYYIPWRYVDKEKLNEILGNNKQIGANLKFDVKFLWKETPTNIIKEGYIIVEDSNIQYKIMNNQDVETSRGIIKGRDLLENDTITNFSNLEVVYENHTGGN